MAGLQVACRERQAGNGSLLSSLIVRDAQAVFPLFVDISRFMSRERRFLLFLTEGRKKPEIREQGTRMEREQRRAARQQMLQLMEAGVPWQEAAATAGVQTSRATAYHWKQEAGIRGEAALQDGRHGCKRYYHRGSPQHLGNTARLVLDDILLEEKNPAFRFSGG